jgi:non-specific serine/threonine protein kinase
MERRRFRSDELRAARAARFAAQLADSLYALGLTHKDLARTLNVAPSTVDSWTRGADPKIPGEATFARLCAWLDAQAPGTGRKLAAAAGRVWNAPATPERPLHIVPAAPPAAAPPTNLPLPLTSFIGRERELAEIQGLAATTRLLTLTGAGGIGKTRLALQVAGALAPSFPDGVWLVELGALADPALVPQAVATALGVREQPGEPLARTVGAHLRARHLLLVLDNCEHLVAACAALSAGLLQASPRLTILATSQEALQVAGEITWPVPPLAVPAAPPLRLAELPACESVRLFMERARLSRPGFDLTLENAAAVAQICARLDGVPLALELAAACLRVLTITQIAARLDDRFRLLTGGSRLALPRHQTLHATVAWSYDLLTSPERTLLARLAVFAGGWTLEAAEAVCGDFGSENPANPTSKIENPKLDVLPLLMQLVAKSLVKVEAGGEAARYILLETIRAYAWERLREMGEAPELRARHARYYRDLAEAAEPLLTGAGQAAWLDRLEVEHDNLRAALRWSEEAPEGGQEGLRLAGALSRFWVLRGYLSEGRAWVAAALAHPGATVGTAARARALVSAGRLAHIQGDLAAARSPLEESAALWREQGDTRQLAYAQTLLGLVLGNLGDPAARGVLTESVALLRREDDPWGLARALFCLGDVVANGEDFAAATRLLEESLALFRQVGDDAFIANTLMALGELAREEGDLARAAALSAESLALYRAQGFTSGIAYTLKDLGDVAWGQGAVDAAREHYAESLRMCRDLDDHEGVAGALLRLGQIAHAEGNPVQAGALLAESVALKRALGYKRGLAQALLHLGWARLDQGAAEEACALVQESLDLALALGSRRGQADALLGLAAGALAQGQPAAAARLLGRMAGLPLPPRPPAPPSPQVRYPLVLAAVRARLDEAAFAAAWAEGRASV